jgi:hypothetical protein
LIGRWRLDVVPCRRQNLADAVELCAEEDGGGLRNDIHHDPKPGGKLKLVGLVFSLVYLLLLTAVAVSHWHAIVALKPNEWADVLGGSFAPLAFLWLVLGFFQQGHELRQNVIALRLQGEELRNSVEQQRALVETTREQVDFERAALQADREEQRRLSRPDFRLETYVSRIGRLSRFRVRAENLGADCSSLVMKLLDGNAHIASHSEGIMLKGQYCSIEHAYESDETIDLDGKDLLIEYVDKRNIYGIQRFRIKSDESAVGKFLFENNDSAQP